MKHLLNCPMNTSGWSHNIAASWRNKELHVHLNAFLCDCTLLPFGQLDQHSMFRRKITRLGEGTVITEIFCWQERMISWVWISTLLSWDSMQFLGELHRGKETRACSYYKTPTGPSLLLHGSEYVHLRTFVYILTFTYLFHLPKSYFLPLNHT